MHEMTKDEIVIILDWFYSALDNLIDLQEIDSDIDNKKLEVALDHLREHANGLK